MKTIKIVSDRYKVAGEIASSSMVKTVSFFWKGRKVKIGISISEYGEDLIQNTKNVIDTYVDIEADEKESTAVRLYYWYLDCEDNETVLAHGRVTGHPKLHDSVFINTSNVKNCYLDWNAKELVVKTRNTIYKCRLDYCDFESQNEYAELIPEYDKVKREFEGKREEPCIEPGKILLVLSNFDEYYFHSLCYIRKEGEIPVKASGYAHVGTFQDSFFIREEKEGIDIRYFPHFRNIEFYSEYTNVMPLFAENIGSATIYIKSSIGIIRLNPGERKQICKDNEEEENVCLPSGDLYPANIIN